jgi:UDP-N-acetylglucosamine/UDP-N-acetylgalactosamine diphosphorylase
MPPSPNSTIQTLAAEAGQPQLLAFWERLDDASRGRLEAQLRGFDWQQIAACQQLAASRWAAAGPAPTLDLSGARTPPCHPLNSGEQQVIEAGKEALAAGSIGGILVAGGQGTRLGFKGPKGTFPVGPVSQATLFELLLGTLRAVKRRYGHRVPLAIMTSTATDAATREFLDRHNFCGLDPEQVLLFQQGTLPAVDAATGLLLLDAPDHVAVAPDGHGGMLGGLAASGGLEWFASLGVETVVSFQVDNPLARPFDPEFLGRHRLTAASFSTQVIRKTDPAERVGVVAEQDGVTRVIEYSDLPDDLAAERLANGQLRFHAGSIAIHAFDRGFLERAAADADSLPLHLAHKQVPCLDPSGRLEQPKSPNAFKFERFIFDLMPLAERVTVVEVAAAEGFAPLKNPSGTASDSPETVRQAMVAYARRHLAAAGIAVADGIDVELDTASILDDDDLRQLAAAGSLPGNRIDHPQVVRAVKY